MVDNYLCAAADLPPWRCERPATKAEIASEGRLPRPPTKRARPVEIGIVHGLTATSL